MKKRVLPLLLLAALLICTVPVSAAGEYTSKDTFWNWIASGGQFQQKLVGYVAGSVCTKSPDTYHHASKYVRESSGHYACVCDYCGSKFEGYESDLKKSYEDTVEELPADGYSSDGGLIYRPSHGDFSVYWGNSYNQAATQYHCPHYTGSLNASSLPFSLTFNCSNGSILIVPGSGSSSFTLRRVAYSYSFVAPVSGYYSRLVSPSFTGLYRTAANVTVSPSDTYSSVSSVYYAQGVSKSFDGVISLGGIDSFSYFNVRWLPPVYKVVPDTSMSDSYPASSRPGSLVGLYGDVNGEAFSNNQLINETNNTFWNPVTNTTYNMSGWTYDYSSRTYTITTDNSTTCTVTYGDENVTINEGDTIYNIYYITQGSGGDTPAGCDHSYTSTVTTEPTCEAPGVRTYTCSKCLNSYTEKIPATGHTWQVKQTVNTEYDEEGNITQQGYTIYKCAVCSTEYKDENGAGPPSDPGGTGGNDGESIWDKLGNLIGSLFSGLLGMIEAVLSKILDALTSLVEMINGKLTQVVELILSFFERIPELFSGFLDFLGAMFGFLPEDVLLLLTFGIAAIVVIGIIKAIRR